MAKKTKVDELGKFQFERVEQLGKCEHRSRTSHMPCGIKTQLKVQDKFTCRGHLPVLQPSDIVEALAELQARVAALEAVGEVEFA